MGRVCRFLLKTLVVLIRVFIAAPLIGLVSFLTTWIFISLGIKVFAKYLCKAAINFAPDLDQEEVIGIASAWSREMLKRKYQ